jgi:hypothetical protein
MAPFEGPTSPPLSSVKHHYHLAITIVDVTFTKPSHFSRSGCMLSDEADIVFSILSTGTTWGNRRGHKERKSYTSPIYGSLQSDILIIDLLRQKTAIGHLPYTTLQIVRQPLQAGVHYL